MDCWVHFLKTGGFSVWRKRKKVVLRGRVGGGTHVYRHGLIVIAVAQILILSAFSSWPSAKTMNISLLFLWQILKSDPNGPDPFLFFKYSFVQTPDPGIRIFFRYVSIPGTYPGSQ